jgi:Flp pilus assembly protein TadD
MGVAELSGNGRFELRVPSRYPFSEDRNPRLRWVHGFLLRLRPGPHRLAFIKPRLHRQSEFCASCHRTSYDLPQNSYKFLRTEDDYGTWQAGPYSGQSIHSFASPGPVKQCQDCHDPHAGGDRASGLGLASSVLGPSKARSGPNTEYRTLETDPVTLDLFSLRRAPRLPGTPEELIAPLDQSQPLLRPGEEVTVDLVVSNQRVGHEFPAGTGNREAWVEMTVDDASSRPLLRSEGVGRSGGISEGTHTYGLIGLDRHRHELVRGDLWNMVTPLYHRSILPVQPDTDRRTIQPGESDVVRYRLHVPTSVPGPLRLRARLWRRKAAVSRQSTVVRSGCSGINRSDASRPTSDDALVAEDSVMLPVAQAVGGMKALCETPAPEVGMSVLSSRPPRPLSDRLYDYGVGLLLQGDLPRAQRAMRWVQALVPLDVRGYLGLGRVYLTEGDLLAARTQFEKARRIAPRDPRPRAFLAATERRMGQYDSALALLQPLERDYPQDRLLNFDIGMCRYLSGHYEEASTAFRRMLDVDPDDLSAHYNLMRCLRRLHRVSEARHEEVIYQTLREDDNAKQVGLAFLQAHPLADRETRTVHEHRLHRETSDE